MKRRKLKKWVWVGIILLGFFIPLSIIAKMNKDFIDSCERNGYTREHCMYVLGKES